ncbi:MAG: CHASE2 domain-containing protein [Pseudomonadota bacterium]|nr:CHASE2 domain-containing protein [Pseudomonadota bacterium]
MVIQFIVAHMFSKTFFLHGLFNSLIALWVLNGLPELKTLIQEQLTPWQSDTVLSGGLTLIDIDEPSYRLWGSPLIMPRDKLKQLIVAAVKGGADVISVDIALSYLSNGCLMTPSAACPVVNLQADAELGLYLKSLNERAFDDRQADDLPIIILRRLYRQPLNTKGQIDTQAFWQSPPSFFDSYLQEEKNVFWGGQFLAPPPQGSLATLVCQHDHLAVALSLPLLTAIAQRYTCADSTRNAAYQLRAFKRRLANWAAQFACDPSQGTTIAERCQQRPCPDLTITVPAKTGFCDHSYTLDLAQEHSSKAITYSTPIQRISARNVLTTSIDVEQQIVMIGQTYQASGNFYSIPLTAKPVAGSYLSANAIDNVLCNHSLRWIFKLLLILTFVWVLTLVLQLYPLLPAFIISLLIMISLLGWHYLLKWPQDMSIALVLMTFFIFIIKIAEKGTRKIFS